MNIKVKFSATALALLIILGAVIPMTVSAEEVAPKIVLTEICYNPTFMENDQGLADSADVLEYVELVNISSETVSLEGITLQYSSEGYDGGFKTNAVIALDGNPRTLAPGEVAVITVYNADTCTAGLAYATAEERKAYYDFFVEFYACSDRIDENHFYIAPAAESGTGFSIEDSFRLGNTHENAVLRIVDKDGNTLCEAGYNAATWNRSGWSMNLFYRPGIVEGHPLASKDYNVAACTPGMIRDNQVTAEGLTPTGPTISVKVMEYNVCASDSTQTRPDGSGIPMDERIGLVFDFINSYDPDVIGLTEINYLWVPRLREEMTQEDGEYGGYGRASKGSTYGSERYSRETWDLYNLILWKTEKYDLVDQGTFWCSKTPDKVNTFNWEDGTVGDFGRAINWVILKEKQTGVEFFFLCGHIDAKVDAARTLSARLITEKATELAEGRPIIMVGDWNANENRDAYTILSSGNFADARYRTSDYEDMTVYNTYNKWGEYTDEMTTRPPIDHCFITHASVFVDSAIMDPAYIDEAGTLYASDHNATVFSLQILASQSSDATEESTESAEESSVEGTNEPVDTPTEPVTQPADNIMSEADTRTTESATDDASEGGCGSALLAALPVLLTAVAAVILCKGKDD